MAASSAGWRKWLAGLWFALCAAVAAGAHMAAALGGYFSMGPLVRPLDFDYPLRMLEVIYAARGLTPYRDFGFVYPPGQVWLYGKVLGLQQPGSVTAAIAVASLLLWAGCAWQLARLVPAARRWFVAGAVLLVMGGAAPFLWGYVPLTEPIPLLALATLLVFAEVQDDPSRARLAALATVAAVETLLRWDWILLFVCLQAGLAGVLWLPGRWLDPAGPMRIGAARLVRAAGVAIAGMTIAMAAIAGVAMATGSWSSARFFIFYLPLHISGYRHLPLAAGAALPWLLTASLMAVVAVTLAAASACSTHRQGFVPFLKAGVLIAPCLALVPYAMGRADSDHFLPLSMMGMVALLAAFALRPGRGVRALLLVVLAINATPALTGLISLAPVAGIQPPDRELSRLHQATEACTRLFPEDARSLFVGQSSYDHFLINTPGFYLMRPDLQPATPFLSDEPGAQNTCELGSRVAADLAKAPRPTVLVLDTATQGWEANLTRTMTNCGRVEAAIASMHAQALGSCQVPYDYVPTAKRRNFEVLVAR